MSDMIKKILIVTTNFRGYDKKVTCFSNKEEMISHMDEEVPFFLETKLRELGADVEIEKPWSEHVCVDGKIITGQNPRSSLLLAEQVVDVLS